MSKEWSLGQSKEIISQGSSSSVIPTFISRALTAERPFSSKFDESFTQSELESIQQLLAILKQCHADYMRQVMLDQPKFYKIYQSCWRAFGLTTSREQDWSPVYNLLVLSWVLQHSGMRIGRSGKVWGQQALGWWLVPDMSYFAQWDGRSTEGWEVSMCGADMRTWITFLLDVDVDLYGIAC